MLNIRRDRSGVALPLALLGLVLVSFLVTAALVSSSTEIAISGAHQEATASLYQADGALEEYLAQKLANAGTTSPAADSLSPVADDALVSGFLVDVARLYSLTDTVGASPQLIRQRQIFSLLAKHASGRGRSVGAQVGTERQAQLFTMQVASGLTVGGDIEVSGKSTISDGRDTGCALGPAPNALQVTAGSTITQSGTSKIEGTADTASFSKTELVSRYLNGLTLQEAVKLASVKFGPGEFSGRVKSHDTGVARDRSHKYNWGCPKGDGCSSYTDAANVSNQSYYPMVALDAGGGKIVLEGNHGQGILIVHNGSLEIKGNLVYEGIVLVEKDLLIQGTASGNGVKIQGAVMALGENSTVQDNASGNATVIFDKCIINTASDAANTNRLAQTPQAFPNGTHSWFEVIR